MTKEKETARGRAARLLQLVKTNALETYTKKEVQDLLNLVATAFEPVVSADDAPGCRAPVAMEHVGRGDVFIAKTLGGKVRPWVVLRHHSDDNSVVAIPLSGSEGAPPGMVPSQCPYWPNNFLGSAIVSFDEHVATAEVTRPFTALKQLDQVERSIVARIAA